MPHSNGHDVYPRKMIGPSDLLTSVNIWSHIFYLAVDVEGGEGQFLVHVMKSSRLSIAFESVFGSYVNFLLKDR